MVPDHWRHDTLLEGDEERRVGSRMPWGAKEEVRGGGGGRGRYGGRKMGRRRRRQEDEKDGARGEGDEDGAETEFGAVVGGGYWNIWRGSNTWPVINTEFSRDCHSFLVLYRNHPCFPLGNCRPTAMDPPSPPNDRCVPAGTPLPTPT
ncbi:hypothetical protein K440DRAFT_641220 [Wilcoxina mikolae CBS 423.85]|nr:hypothetical protein K440DRAFT_641220 [Wilcoxina mikolae CBS 423.85]